MSNRPHGHCAVLLFLLLLVTCAALPRAQAAEPTMEELSAKINAAGKTLPDWWDPNFKPPAGLDLTGKVKGWKPNQNIGTHMFIVLPRPNKWKYGIQLMDHVFMANADPRQRRNCILMKANLYARLEDWPRSAFFWRQADAFGGGDMPYGLLRCLWKMGARSEAVKALGAVKVDDHNDAKAIRLWSEMGETDRALALAKASLDGRGADAVCLAAGDACRKAGRLDDAATWYNKVLAQGEGTRYLKRNLRRAKDNLDGVTHLKKVTGAALKDGAHVGQAEGFRGKISVEIKIDGGKVAAVAVKHHRDDRAYDAMKTVPERIAAAGGIAGVDAVTGATISSEGVMNATADALAKAAGGK